MFHLLDGVLSPHYCSSGGSGVPGVATHRTAVKPASGAEYVRSECNSRARIWSMGMHGVAIALKSRKYWGWG